MSLLSRNAFSFALFGGLGTVLCLAILNALELILPDAPPFVLRLLQVGACLLVGLGAVASARAPLRVRRFVVPAALLTTATTVALLWRHSIHGSLSAISAVTTGRHTGSTLARSIPPRDACINGYVVKYLPLVWGCFGRVGTRPIPYYSGYYATVWFLYDLLPDGTRCDEATDTDLVIPRPPLTREPRR